MQRDPLRPRWSLTVLLIVVNVTVFAFQMINAVYLSFPLGDYLALSRAGLSHGYVWQLLTYQFLHGGLLHLALNCLCIYMFGRTVEERLGRAAFLRVYLLSGVIGGLCQSLLGAFWRAQFGVSVVGASASVYGLIAVAVMLEPDGVILFSFILPIRAKYFLYLSAALALFFIVVPAEPGIAHAAHLGGMAAGYAYWRWGAQFENLFARSRVKLPRSRPRELIKVNAPKSAGWKRSKQAGAEDLPPAEFISREVDPILDKILAHGFQSLTERERNILDAARNKMPKR